MRSSVARLRLNKTMIYVFLNAAVSSRSGGLAALAQIRTAL